MSGVLSYNGYTFADNSTHIEVSVEFVYDEGGVLIIAHKHTLVVTSIVTDSDPLSTGDLDIDMSQIRARLGESGKPLRFWNKGFGVDLRVHPRGRRAAIDGGPFPQELSWTPLGDNKAAEIVWTVEVTVPVCVGPTARHFGISALNYTIDYSIDEHGSTTRTLSGYMEIARSSTSIDTADNYRHRFSPPLLPNFKREQQWAVSADKRRLTFTITDTEVDSPNPYPPSVTAIEGSHRVTWGRGRQAAKFKNTISMTIRPEAGISGAFAWKLFVETVNRRLRYVERADKEWFINSLEVEEDLFGRPQSFSCGYELLGGIEDFAATAGLWTPLGGQWGRWSASLKDTAFNPQGTEKLHDLGSDSVIITLCNPQQTTMPNNAQRKISTKRRELPKPLRNKMPTADKDKGGGKIFRKFKGAMAIHRFGKAVEQLILQAHPNDTGGYNPFDPLLKAKGVGGVPTYPKATASTPNVIQTTGIPSHVAYLSGESETVGVPMDRIKVEKVGSAFATEVESMFIQELVDNFLGVPVFKAKWLSKYILSGGPDKVTPPINHNGGS